MEYRGCTPSVGVQAATGLRPTTRKKVPQQPGSSPQLQDSWGPCAYSGCYVFESYGGYSGHFQCVVSDISSDEFGRLIDKNEPKKGLLRTQIQSLT